MKKIFIHNLTVDLSLLDSYGHVNNASYLVLYEKARWALMKKHNVTEETVQELQQGPIILECHIHFKKELKLHDKLQIQTRASLREGIARGKIIDIDQEMFRQLPDGTLQLASTAKFVVGLMDLSSRKMIHYSESWLKSLGL